MKLMLTSFGIGAEHLEPLGLARSKRPKSRLFVRMPPLDYCLDNSRLFFDASVLLLCDEVVIDAQAFDKLTTRPHRLYDEAGKTLAALRDEGLLSIANFDSILAANRDLLGRMQEHDLQVAEQWIGPFLESDEAWETLALQFALALVGSKVDSQDDETRYLSPRICRRLGSIDERPALRELMAAPFQPVFREFLAVYLSFVNANIVISRELGAGFHDWADFRPFYRQKFLYVGQQDVESEQNVEAVRALFQVSFPELRLESSKALIRALNDSRVRDLRRLVQDAVDGKVTFDEHYARSVFKEVLGLEEKAARYRQITSYLTIPLGFIPGVGTFVQKATEEVVGHLVEKKLREKYRWFYLLSGISRETRTSRPTAT